MSASPSLQLELTLDPAPFVWSDQTLVGIADGMQRPVEARLPEVQKLVHFRKIRRKIIVLPDIGLQDGFEFGNAVEDMRGGKSIAIELMLQIR